jgi:tRNA 5-methylaminomethyl-2-thiouridine biosynthesis bifunctional protein
MGHTPGIHVICDTDFGNGDGFLQHWHAWRRTAIPAIQAVPASERLHYIAVVASSPSVSAHAGLPQQHGREHNTHALQALAAELTAACHGGWLPGVHRLCFDDEQVHLTLLVGESPAQFRDQRWTADQVLLRFPANSLAPSILSTITWAAQRCRRGTRIDMAAPNAQALHHLAQCGFLPHNNTGSTVPIAPPNANVNVNGNGNGNGEPAWQGEFQPRWVPRTAPPKGPQPWPASPPGTPHRVVVIGAGISGASVAYSLALRGWHVQVLDAAPQPAHGASGLPAGLVAPHVSADDRPISRLTRNGVAATLGRAARLLQPHHDWGQSGVLEHSVAEARDRPTTWPSGQPAHPGWHWSREATPQQRHAAGLAPGTQAHWHARAGWIRPAALVNAMLQHPNIRFRGHCSVTRLERPSDEEWHACDAHGHTLAHAPLVVVAGGFDSLPLLTPWSPHRLPLHALRGQVTVGRVPQPLPGHWPPFPVNGWGSFVPQVPHPDGPVWVSGATFEREANHTRCHRDDDAANQAKLLQLLPQVGATLETAFAVAGQTHAWAGVRCTLPDRLPMVGPLDTETCPGLWVSTGMGARGLTLGVLCGELLAAWLHAEPLPLEPRLASQLQANRWRPSRSPVGP